MGRIAVLDKQTIDKIAAGEVVERPSSVVKELTENAIDAGATQITVEIREGGIGYIRITDNGMGMEKEDIPLAFLRHSTSKIRSADDLMGVVSLGFRGEALSSISAVSMVELITKTRENTLGSRCCLEGGETKSLEDIGAPDGTTFIVRNLFYNTPARKKFLKTQMSEAAAVHETMTHLALSHPEISFRLIINNQTKLQTAGNGNLKDVIYHVYGREVAMRLLDVDRTCGPLEVSGYAGKPEISRGNRNYESYFVNGRYVKSKIIAKGIEDGYKTFMMQHRYPFVCLDIKIDGKLLDVNVHPTKMELRFSDQNLVYEAVREAVQSALSGRELIPEAAVPAPGTGRAAAPTRAEKEQERAAALVQAEKEQPPLEKLWKTPPKEEPEKKAPQDKNLDYFMSQMRERVETRHRLSPKKEPEAPGMQPPKAPLPQTIREENGCYAEKPQQLDLFDGKLLSKEAAAEHVILGQLFDTYWLVQYTDKLYIIDQHAAHEKVLYERLMKNSREKSSSSQLLSPPIVLNLSMKEEQLYLKYQQCFADMGFEIEEFGEGAYAVRAVPSDLPQVAERDILLELMDSLTEITGNISSESLLDKMASMSCKAAVKGNHRMSAAEAKTLIGELLTLDNPYNCPHGRPTIISMTKYELEKKFKRIV